MCTRVPYDASHGCPAEVVLTQVPAAVPTALHPCPSYPPQESARQTWVTCKEELWACMMSDWYTQHRSLQDNKWSLAKKRLHACSMSNWLCHVKVELTQSRLTRSMHVVSAQLTPITQALITERHHAYGGSHAHWGLVMFGYVPPA